MRLEGLGKLKNPMTSEIEPTTFRLCNIVPQSNTLQEVCYVRNASIKYATRGMLRT
jgi:hypothetical protein